jgi:hypothetical protein
MAVRALCVQAEARRRSEVRATVEGRHGRVARKAQLGHALVRQHVPIRRTVRAMTYRATFGARGWVLEHERAAFVGMAPDAFFLLEAAE